MSGGSYALQAAAGQPGTRILGDGAPYYVGAGLWFAARNENVALPVELTAFEAVRAAEHVVLTWATESETNNAGFEVERATADGAFERIGFEPGAGTTAEAQTYRFTDVAVPYEATRLTYRLKQVDTDGAFEYSPTVEIDRSLPERVALLGNYPNPFRSQTTIRYAVPRTGPVHLSVYDVLGRQVTVLVDGKQPAGRTSVTFAAESLPSGIYFMRLRASAKTITRKLTIVR